MSRLRWPARHCAPADTGSGARAAIGSVMNTINATPGPDLAASLWTPRNTSALTDRDARRFVLRAVAISPAHRPDATTVIRRCAPVQTSGASFTAGSSLFAHIGNVAAFTAGRGLAQPA